MMGYLVNPLMGEIKKTSASVTNKNQELLAAKNVDINYLKTLEINYKTISENINALKTYLDENQVVGFIQELEGVANNVSASLDIKSANFPVFNLSLTGSFSATMKFLGWLENSPYFIDIESMQVRKISERDIFSKDSKLFSVDDINTTFQIKLPSKKNESE